MEYYAYSMPKSEFMKEVNADRKGRDVMFYVPSAESKGASSIFRESKKLSKAYEQEVCTICVSYSAG
jgi:hypothetical protein